MNPCYNPMQLSEENVAICVSFAPLKTSNSDGYFSVYTIFYHDKYRNKKFRNSVNKTYENQDFRNEVLLQNVSARVWQNLVVFSSSYSPGFFIEGPVCGRSRTAQSGQPWPLWGLMG